jgi:hypothetical protein
MIRRMLLGFFCGLLITPIAWAALTQTIDPATGRLGDTLRLTLILQDEPASTTDPDLSPLAKDFKVVGTQKSLAYEFVQGQSRLRAEWVILLTPKRAGQLQIPVLKWGLLQTKSLPLLITDQSMATVKPVKKTIKDGPDAVLLQTEVDTQTPYINAQVIYTVRILNRKSLMDAVFSPPVVQDAVLFKLGNNHEYETVVKGERYHVMELKYAIFAQKSGDLTIHAPTFQALLFDGVQTAVHATDKDTVLHLKPVPSFFHAPWLPAHTVKLTESYEPGKTSWRQGETVTRFIMVDSIGMPAQLLPAMHWGKSSAWQLYADTPMFNNTLTEKAIAGRALYKLTYVLRHSGAVTLPAVQLPWFNTVTNKIEMAEIASKVIQVQASSPAVVVAPASQQKVPLPTVTKAQRGLRVKDGAMGIGGLLLLWAFYRRDFFLTMKRKKTPRQLLRQACRAHQALEAQTALFAVAKQRWPLVEIRDLESLAKQANHLAFQQALQILAKTLYDPACHIPWNGRALWKAWLKVPKKRIHKKTKRSLLPPLYP